VKTNDANNFELCEDNLSEIIGQIPQGMKVGVVSVVGAFRTGKSFLLNFFLRYLRHGNVEDLSEDWMTKDGDFLSEGNMNENNVNVASEDGSTKSSISFGWRGGEERQTTGIWMWSKPFIRHCPKCGEDIAIILVDTQGMFDNETTMTTTAQIFGLSTLIASYQICKTLFLRHYSATCYVLLNPLCLVL
jgi:atlastin